MKNKANKSAIINFRVTDSQKEEINAIASGMNLSVSGYLSHLISDYEERKTQCEELGRKNIECMTQKQIVEAALHEATKESESLANSAFTDLFESVKGQLVGKRHIKSKADLVGVLAASAEISVVEGDEMEISLPLEVENRTAEKSGADRSRWIYLMIAIVICAVLLGAYLGRKRTREPRANKMRIQ